MRKKNKLVIYSSKTYPMTDEDRKRLDEIFRKEREKRERDMKCGGVDEQSGHYIALHHR